MPRRSGAEKAWPGVGDRCSEAWQLCPDAEGLTGLSWGIITMRDLGRSQPKPLCRRLKMSEVLAFRTLNGGSLVPTTPLPTSRPQELSGNLLRAEWPRRAESKSDPGSVAPKASS